MEPLRVLFVASEATPLAKTGGLADVVTSLGRELVREGHDVRVVIPMYRRIAEGGFVTTPVAGLQDLELSLGTKTHFFSVSRTELGGDGTLSAELVRCPELFHRDAIYTQDADEPLRFAFLTRAAVRICQATGWSPDIVHVHDWHTALLPLYLRKFLSWDALFERTKTVLTIHNLGYQGVFSSEHIAELELEDHEDLLWDEDLRQGRINFLRTGILYAHAITTVSETYAREIQTEEHGHGLDPLLRRRAEDVVGIVNGVDYGEWSPESDRRLARNYSAAEPEGKTDCRNALLARLGLPDDPRGPVFGIVTRLTAQKGLELLPDAIQPVLQSEDVRLCVLGSGEERYERYFSWLAETHPGKVAFRAGYDEDLAHQIEAGADIFLMPSRYEPCGLNQMYSLRYGTVPIVRRTGGLADTVEPYDERSGEGTGFLFDAFNADALFEAMRSAISTFRHPEAWGKLMRNGMQKDFSWERQVRPYVDLYRRLIASQTER